jgi:type III secretion system FlhB-like substrate exporter
MDLTRLLSLLGACVPAVAVAGAVIAKEVLNLDPPETIIDVLIKAPPEERAKLMTFYNTCNEVADELEKYIRYIQDIVEKYKVEAYRVGAAGVGVLANDLMRISSYIMEGKRKLVERFSKYIPPDVIDKTYPPQLFDVIASTAEYIAKLMMTDPNLLEVETTADKLILSLKARVRAGFIECLKFSGIIK